MQMDFFIDTLWFCIWQHDDHIEIAALNESDNMFASSVHPESISAIDLITEVQTIKDKYDVHLHQLEKERLQNISTEVDDIPF